MHWYCHLYVGEKAKRHRFAMIQAIRENRLSPLAYVITPASNGNNLLDIYPAAMLLMPGFPKDDLWILGIASGYWEALELVRKIVDDIYQRTGELSLDALPDFKR